jgi:hypothetical protein
MLENDNWVLINNEIDVYNIEKTSKIKKFTVPITINKFVNFKEIKNNIVYLINNEKNYKKEIDNKTVLNISRSDFHNSKDFSRKWVNFIEEDFAQSIVRLCADSGYNGFQLKNIWFQQYNQSSSHGWHLHGTANYSGVFYVEMPKDGPRTEFFNPLTKEIFSLKMNEGEIAIFPSFALHRSPENKSKDRKTIISFNIDFAFPDEKYHLIKQ